jgi:hypothetical protein
MKRVFRILALVLMIALSIPSSMVLADSPTIQEYLNTGGDGNSDDIYGVNYVAMQFTSNATAHTATAIRVMLKRTGNPGTVTVALREADSGEPSSTVNLAYGTLDGNDLSTSYSWREVDLDTDYAIEASTQYAIVVIAENGDTDNDVQWQVDAGGGLADAVSSHSTDGGITWTSDTPEDCLFEVYGNSVLSIESGKVFQGYIETGDMLFCAEVINLYPPYANVTNPKDYFQLQLLGLDGSTVLAATPMTAWGDRPQSIYLSASSASSLTVGGAYTIKIVGTFTSPPSATYVLQSSDWKGSNLSYLDDWIIATAWSIEDYYSLTGTDLLTQYVQDAGIILTDNGGSIFTSGIPGISQKRPDIFTVNKDKPELDLGTDNNTYDKAPGEVGDYEDMLGSEIAGDLDTWGELFSMDGNNFGGLLIALGCVVVVLFGLILGGRAAIPLFVVGGVPLLYIGNFTQIVGIQWTVVLSTIMVILFVRQMWWKTT